MVKVKSNADIQANYEAATADVPRRFEAGVRTAAWKQAAADGQKLYVEKMSQSDILARRARGIDKVSDEQWRKDAIDKGRNVIGARMKAAAPKQIANAAPYLDALRSLSLPEKTSDPMANVVNRVGAVVKAMVDTNKSIKG